MDDTLLRLYCRFTAREDDRAVAHASLEQSIPHRFLRDHELVSKKKPHPKLDEAVRKR